MEIVIRRDQPMGWYEVWRALGAETSRTVQGSIARLIVRGMLTETSLGFVPGPAVEAAADRVRVALRRVRRRGGDRVLLRLATTVLILTIVALAAVFAWWAVQS